MKKFFIIIICLMTCIPQMDAQTKSQVISDIIYTMDDFASDLSFVNERHDFAVSNIQSISHTFGSADYFMYNNIQVQSFRKWLEEYCFQVLNKEYVGHELEIIEKTVRKVDEDEKNDKRYRFDAFLTRSSNRSVNDKVKVTFIVEWKGEGKYVSILEIKGKWYNMVNRTPDENRNGTITEKQQYLKIEDEDNGWAWWQFLLAVLIGIPVLFFLIGFFKGVYNASNKKQTANKDNSKSASDTTEKELTNTKTGQKQIDSQPAHSVQDDAETLYEQGIKYLQGNGIKKDTKQALEHFSKSHVLGYPNATYMLAYCYYQGLGTFENKELALQFFHKAEKTGRVPNAAYYLGICYEEIQQYQTAFRWFKEAVANGVTEAHLKVGRYYETGLGGWKNEGKAFQQYSDAVYHGYAEAEYHLGRCYYDGIGTPKNLNEALKCWRNAESKGYTEAIYRMALHYSQEAEKSDDFRKVSVFLKKAAEYFKKAANEGHVEAMYHLAECYYTGQGLPLDYGQADRWYALAAENGNTDAMYKQALLLYNISKDTQKAVIIWKKAADLGHTESMYSLAQHYAGDRTNRNNVQKALEYYSKAEKSGHNGAKRALQQLNQELYKADTAKHSKQFAKQETDTSAQPTKDSTIESPSAKTVSGRNKMLYNRAMADYNAKRYDEAFRQFHRLAKEGYEHAEYMTGMCYAQGYGTSIDLKQATEFIHKAANKNHTEAQFEYGMMLFHGKNMAINKLNASKYFRMAAIKKHPEAMYMLAQCYEFGGKGMNKNYKEATKWYKNAVKIGYTPAKEALLRVKDRMH